MVCDHREREREARYTSRSDFGGEEFAFAVDAPAIAGEASVLADDAVAGNGDGDGVGAAGGGDGAGSGGLADFAGEFGVAAGFAARDLLEGFPDALLEGGSADVEWEGGSEGMLGGLAGDEGDGVREPAGVACASSRSFIWPLRCSWL